LVCSKNGFKTEDQHKVQLKDKNKKGLNFINLMKNPNHQTEPNTKTNQPINKNDESQEENVQLK